MANLPPTHYLEAGPATPMASPGAAAAPAQAYAQLGNTIAAVGEQGMQIAGRLQKIEDHRQQTQFSLRMEEFASKFAIGLMTREDTGKWLDEYKQGIQKLKQEAKALKLSSAGRADFDEYFSKWETRTAISIETQAATKGIELARATTANAVQQYLDMQNYEGAMNALTSAQRAGLIDTPALQKGIFEIQKKQRHDDILGDIDDDPASWLNDNQKPLPGYDMAEWNRLRSHARGVERERTYEVSANVMDRVVSGHISRPEQIEQEAAQLRPTEQAKLKEFLGDYQRAEMENLRNDPAWQAQTLGKFERLLSDYVPVSGDSADMPGVELMGLVAAMPAGPLKEDMQRRVQAVKENQKAEAENQLDLMLQQVTAAGKSGHFGKLREPQQFDTDKAIRDGFLRGTQGLQGLGFSAEQAKQIATAVDANKESTDAARLKKFRELWKDRENPAATGNPWSSNLANAILANEGSFTTEPAPDDYAKAGQQAMIDLRVGQIRAGMQEWARLNPEAARDPEKIRIELQKRTKLEITKPVTRIKPRAAIPTETSMNSLPKPLAPLAPVFETAGREHGIDPRFLMAIAMHETGGGTSSAFRNKRNAMGVSDASGPIAFEDPAESIQRMARVLASANGPYRNARTLEEIAKVYAPVGAGNDPRGLNKHWTAGVSKYLRQLGGDPNKIFLNA